MLWPYSVACSHLCSIVHCASGDRVSQAKVDSSFLVRGFCAVRALSCCSEDADFMVLKLFSGLSLHAFNLETLCFLFFARRCMSCCLSRAGAFSCFVAMEYGNFAWNQFVDVFKALSLFC